MGLRGGGPSELIAGTYEQGYYGEVPTSEFITGDQLATQIGLTVGTPYNSEAGWLKFSLDYKTLYVAKRPFRYNLTWNAINAVGAVSGSKTITIAGKTYKVRLLKGRGDGLTNDLGTTGTYDAKATWNSEWNRLLYHVSGKPFANVNNTLASEGISVGDWAQYSEADLLTYNSYGSGSYCWCQDSSGTNKIIRGGLGVSLNVPRDGSTADTGRGWRPCLELVG